MTRTTPPAAPTRPAAPAEERVVLYGISYQTYERLLEERGERSVPRMTYDGEDGGVLELMSPGQPHGHLERLFEAFVNVLCQARRLDLVGLGSLTVKDPDWQKGFEPDACFWLGAAAATLRAGPREYDPRRVAPPDLLVEVDISRSSIAKDRIFATFGVREVWRHDGQRLDVRRLVDGAYRSVAESIALPGLTAERLTHLLDAGLRMPRPEWLDAVSAAARETASTS